MTFGMTLADYLTKAASANMFYFAIVYENEPNMKVAAGNVSIKINQLFFKQRILGVAWPLHSGKPHGAWQELAIE